jgi:hypothetical protein
VIRRDEVKASSNCNILQRDAELEDARFSCATCTAGYYVVRVEAPLTAKERVIACINYGAPLAGATANSCSSILSRGRVVPRNRPKR